MAVGLGSTVEELVKAINDSSGGSGGSGGGTYAHLVSFNIYDISDSDIGGICSFVIYSASESKIIDTSTTALIDYIKKITSYSSSSYDSTRFMPVAIRTNGYTSLPYSGILYNTTEQAFRLVGENSSYTLSSSKFTCSWVSETVVQIQTGGSGGGSGSSDNNAPVLISVASVFNNTSSVKINVRVISGTLQAGDRLEICQPIKKTVFNRKNGVKTNIRIKQKLRIIAYRTITAAEAANITTNNILGLTIDTSLKKIISRLWNSCTNGPDGRGAAAPRTIRITRPTEYGHDYVLQNRQISNSVYVTRNWSSQIIKGM